MHREQRERKLERVQRAKAAMEENPDAQRKDKVVSLHSVVFITC